MDKIQVLALFENTSAGTWNQGSERSDSLESKKKKENNDFYL